MPSGTVAGREGKLGEAGHKREEASTAWRYWLKESGSETSCIPTLSDGHLLSPRPSC